MLRLALRVLLVAGAIETLSICLMSTPACGQDQLSASNAATTDMWIRERDRLWRAAQQAAVQGKAVEAAKQAGSVIAILREHWRDDSSQLIPAYTFLAQQQQAAEAWEAAKEAWEQVLRLTRGLYGENDYRVGEARLALQHLAKLEKLRPEQRKKLRTAEAADVQAQLLYQEGKYAEGIKVVSAGLATREQLLDAD